jgi:hypothetical protein
MSIPTALLFLITGIAGGYATTLEAPQTESVPARLAPRGGGVEVPEACDTVSSLEVLPGTLVRAGEHLAWCTARNGGDPRSVVASIDGLVFERANSSSPDIDRGSLSVAPIACDAWVAHVAVPPELAQKLTPSTPARIVDGDRRRQPLRARVSPIPTAPLTVAGALEIDVDPRYLGGPLVRIEVEVLGNPVCWLEPGPVRVEFQLGGRPFLWSAADTGSGGAT